MEKQKQRPILAFSVVCLVVVALWALTWWGVPRLFPDPEKQGLFGDMFGSVNALFSALALAGVIVSLYFQRQELHLTVEQLRSAAEAQQASQKTLAESVEAQRAATQAMRGQRTALLDVAKVLGENGRLGSLAAIIQGYGHDRMVRINGTPQDEHYRAMWGLVKQLEKEYDALYNGKARSNEGADRQR